MEFSFGVIFFISAIYVFIDASKRNIPTALRWSILTALVWLLAFPFYLIVRKKLKTNNIPSDVGGDVEINSNNAPYRPAIYALLFVLSFAMYGVNFYRGWLPSCDSKEVHSVLKDLLDNAAFSNPAQNSYEKLNEIRHCNITLADRIYSYTVTWYSESKDRFIVKFDN